MNAMNWVFVPTGSRPATLERWFRRAYRAFYSRPDVIWGLAKMLAGEPRFIRRMATYARRRHHRLVRRPPERDAEGALASSARPRRRRGR
jgi:hypothetical protein